MSVAIAGRRMGDQIVIAGDYQYRVCRDGWAAQRFWHHARMIEAQRWLAPGIGDTILDVGCGSGVFAALLAQRAGTRVIGVDSNRAAIEFARRQFRRANLEFRLGYADDLGLPDGSIDKIAFLEVIEHLPAQQARRVIGQLARLLCPGGRLVISTPNARSLWPLIEWSLDRTRVVPHMAGDQHVSAYEARSLARAAERCGLRLIERRTINFVAPWLAPLSWKLAEAVHRFEQTRPHLLGSILLATFEKTS